MARRPRRDGPDTWHHAMNRALSRRTLFETDEDRRFFLSLLAREVRNGRLEIHAYSLMLTHFHLLVRSVNGQLSAAMRRIQNRYARRFNRTRKRDGSLFRGRFLSRRIDDLAYRRNVVTYIHDNAIAAGVVARAQDHVWCSAYHLARSSRPGWLATDWIDDECRRRGGRVASLDEAFASRIDEDFRRWVVPDTVPGEPAASAAGRIAPRAGRGGAIRRRARSAAGSPDTGCHTATPGRDCEFLRHLPVEARKMRSTMSSRRRIRDHPSARQWSVERPKSLNFREF